MKFTQVARRNPRLRKLAYTLVEVVICVALVVIMFVSLYGGMSTGFAVTQGSRENLRATQIMLEYMEGIRLYNWDQLTASNWVPTSVTNWYYPLAATNESRGIPYYTSLSVTTNFSLSPSASYSTNMRMLLVTVTWTNAGYSHTRSMSTYVARNGMQNYVFSSISN